MVLISVYLHALCKLTNFPVNTYVEVALSAHLVEELTVVTLSVSHQGSKDVDSSVEIVRENHVDDFLLCVFHHLLSRTPRISHSSTSIKQAEEIVDFCLCAHCRARVFVCCLLFDADNRRESSDFIYVRAFHATKEIAGISRECLYIPSLSLSIDGVEGKRRLSRARKSCYHRQRFARNAHVYIFQVMYTSTKNLYDILLNVQTLFLLNVRSALFILYVRHVFFLFVVDIIHDSVFISHVANHCCVLPADSVYPRRRFTSRLMVYFMPSAPRAFTRQ